MRHHHQSGSNWSQEYECIECMITCYLENKKNKNNNNTALILCEFTYAHFPGKIYLLALFSFGFDFVTDTYNTSNVINISFGYKQCSQTVYYDYLIYETMTWSCNNENFWAKLSKTQFQQRMHHENYIDKWISCCLRRFFKYRLPISYLCLVWICIYVFFTKTAATRTCKLMWHILKANTIAHFGRSFFHISNRIKRQKIGFLVNYCMCMFI